MKTKVSLQHDPKRRLPWRVRWFGEPDDDGKQRRYSRSFRHSREAKDFRIEKQAGINRDGPETRHTDATLGQLIDEFVEARVRGLSFSSRTCYANTLGQLREHFGSHRAVRAITQRHAETFMSTRKRRDGRCGDLSSHALAQHVTYARAMFSAAAEWGYCPSNPFVPARRATQSPLRVKGKSRPWHHMTPDEFRSMLGVVTLVQRRAAFWLMYGCGLRPGEAYNITHDWIDLDRREVHVRSRAATETLPPFTVKADAQSQDGKSRIVPIPSAAIPDITAALAASFKAGGLLVLSPERYDTVRSYWAACRADTGWGGHEWRPWQNRDMLNNLLRDTKAYLIKAGVSLSSPFTLHTFRKSFAQNHADAGTPPRTLAELLGHGDTSVTMTFYNRVTDSNRRAAASTIDRLLAGQTHAEGVRDAM